MGRDRKTNAAEPSNREKDSEDWTNGDETMTGAQASYLQTLCTEAGVEFDPALTNAPASKRIEELQARTLIIAGSQDRIADWSDQSDSSGRTVRAGKTVIVTEAGHMVHQTHLDQVSSAIEEHVALLHQ